MLLAQMHACMTKSCHMHVPISQPPTVMETNAPRTYLRAQVILCSACSGHGFKLSPAVGLVLADMVRHDGRCPEFEQQLRLHKLDRRRPGHAKVLDRFAAAAH